MKSIFPEPIHNLPRADIPLKGLRAYLSQSENHQILFMEFEEDVEIPEHSHGAQIGIVLEGVIELTVDGEKQTYRKGDRYFIPAGVKHTLTTDAGSRIIEVWYPYKEEDV